MFNSAVSVINYIKCDGGNMRWVTDNYKFTVTTIVKSLVDMDLTEINAILSITSMIKRDEKLKNISDDTIYSYYKAELETVGAIQNANITKKGVDE